MDMLISFLVFVIVVVAALYVVRLIPDATLQNVGKVVVVVGALIWLALHLRPLLAAVMR